MLSLSEGGGGGQGQWGMNNGYGNQGRGGFGSHGRGGFGNQGRGGFGNQGRGRPSMGGGRMGGHTVFFLDFSSGLVNRFIFPTHCTDQFMSVNRIELFRFVSYKYSKSCF